MVPKNESCLAAQRTNSELWIDRTYVFITGDAVFIVRQGTYIFPTTKTEINVDKNQKQWTREHI